MVALANEPRFADARPARIVPALADEGVYVASESGFHRVPRAHGQMTRRGRARPPRASGPPRTHVATAPGQVCCRDVTFLPTHVRGRWFYPFLILDLYSRKVVGFEVHDTDAAEHAARLARRTALAEGVHAMPIRPVLHGDNGASLKATTTTVPAMLHWPGIRPSHSRPRVSDDNAFAEALFRTAKYRPEFPARGFDDLDAARRAVGGRLRALVQPRPPPRLHPLRRPGAAPRGPGRAAARRPPRAVRAGTRGQPAALERADPRLDAGRRRDPQPGAGDRRRRGGTGPNRAFPFDRRTRFPVPPWKWPGRGARRRGWEGRSRPEPRAADRVALSPSACSRRIQRLRDDGYLRRRVAVLDRGRRGVPTTLFVLLRSGRHAADWVDAFRGAIGDIAEVVEAHRLTGNFDYLLKLVLPDVEHYDVVYKRLTRRIELFDVSAYISMETLKAETALPTEFAE